MKKSKSSAQWVQDHEKDEYVQRARREGYRSRASYKLLEIDDKHRLIKPGGTIVDLGAAPGGWTQIAVKRSAPGGFVIGIDLLEMEPMEGALILQGDFTDDSVLEQLQEMLGGQAVDLVFSDMAPNLSGMKDIDQPGAMYLVELAVDFACSVLKPGGALLTKCFEGEGIAELRESIRMNFKQLSNVKPKASRGKSREIYLLARGFKGETSNKS
jgi:23S rRNA (uridine2552-2'-O)-methyltransferase